MNGWIGVDFDGTMARYEGWQGPYTFGEPIPAMVDRIKAWLAEGIEVRIVTARVSPVSCAANVIEPTKVKALIRLWCLEHLGEPLEVTHEKDFGMIELWDDRAVQVEPNTGRRVDGKEAL